MKKRNTISILIIITNVFFFSFYLAGQTQINFSDYNPESEVLIKNIGIDLIRAEWKTTDGGRCAITLDLKDETSLFKTLEASSDQKGPMTIITSNLKPRFDVTIGTRTETTKAYSTKSWPYIFFDKVDLRPHKKYNSLLTIDSAKVVSDGLNRVKIIISKISAGSFSGNLVIGFYSGSPFINVVAEMMMKDPGAAYIYDGLICGTFDSVFYKDNITDNIISEKPEIPLQSKTVRHRTIMAGFPKGTLAVFPPPHAFIYPLDFSNNYGFVQAGEENGEHIIGTKSQPNGDNRYRPWIDAPKNKKQSMGCFLLLSLKNPEITLDCVAKYTHNDTYKEIPGYITFANHFHAAIAMTDSTVNPSGPKFRDAMMALNVKTVQIADFHGDGNPKDTGFVRLNQLKKMFEVCEKYSVPDSFTMIPGEEANAYFPGHTMYFFPKQVYLTLRKGLTQPYQEIIPGYGKVFHAGSEIDIYNIYRDNGGIVWTSHPRIKSSQKTPDMFVHHPTFQDDNVFFGGDWKAMPLDLSDDRLGVRSLKLLDDMNQLGFRKGILGEVDPFKIDISHELYAHMNINYVKVSGVPSAKDWSPVFDAIKNFDFFTTTGEVLIHKWDISPSKDSIIAYLEWTFPMAFAEVTWGEGDKVKRKKFSLSSTKEFVNTVQRFEWPISLHNAKWIRFEAWDIARNGAFTQTLWLKPPRQVLTPVVYNFTLVNGDDGCPIPDYDPIQEGEMIQLSKLETRNLIIRANSNLMDVVSVSFSLNDDSNFAISKAFPYSTPVILGKGKNKIAGTPSIGEIVGNTKVLNFFIKDE